MNLKANVLLVGLLTAGSAFGQPGVDTDGDGLVTRAEAHAAVDARFERLDRKLLTSLSRHQNDRDQRIVGPNGPNQVQPVHLRHVEIGQDNVRHVELDALQRVDAVFGIDDLKLTCPLEQPAHQAPVDLRIVDDENCLHESAPVATRIAACL